MTTTTRSLGCGMMLVVTGAIAFAAVAPASLRAEIATGGIACLFLELTGLPCPFCGMTRATLALGAGDLEAAFGYHPLAPLVLALTLWGALGLARGELRLRGKEISAGHVLSLVMAIWAVKLAAHAAW